MPKTKRAFKVVVCFLSPPQKMTLVLAVVALVSAFGSSFQYGYNVSVINSPDPVGWTTEQTTAWEQVYKQNEAGVQREIWGVCGQMLVLLRALSQQGPAGKWFPSRGEGAWRHVTAVRTLPGRGEA